MNRRTFIQSIAALGVAATANIEGMTKVELPEKVIIEMPNHYKTVSIALNVNECCLMVHTERYFTHVQAREGVFHCEFRYPKFSINHLYLGFDTVMKHRHLRWLSEARERTIPMMRIRGIKLDGGTYDFEFSNLHNMVEVPFVDGQLMNDTCSINFLKGEKVQMGYRFDFDVWQVRFFDRKWLTGMSMSSRC